MSADGKPDDMALACTHLGAVSEYRPAIGGPAHLEAARHPDDAFDPQSGTEVAALEVLDEAPNRSLERRPLLVGEPVELTPESFGRLIRRHRRRLQRREELVVAAEATRTTGRKIA